MDPVSAMAHAPVLRFVADRPVDESPTSGSRLLASVELVRYPPRVAIAGGVCAAASWAGLILAIRSPSMRGAGVAVAVASVIAASRWFYVAGVGGLVSRANYRVSLRETAGGQWTGDYWRAYRAGFVGAAHQSPRGFDLVREAVPWFVFLLLAAAAWSYGSAAVSAAMPVAMAIIVGRTVLRWRRRPFVAVRIPVVPCSTGTTARVTVSVRSIAPGAPFDRVAVRLECVRERVRGCGLLGVRRERLWGRECRLSDELPDRPFAVEVDFDVPAGLPGTDLLGDPAVVWQVVVEGDGRMGRHGFRVLAPVFGPAAEGDADAPAPLEGSGPR